VKALPVRLAGSRRCAGKLNALLINRVPQRG
jgi:hypothetical protein